MIKEFQDAPKHKGIMLIYKEDLLIEEDEKLNHQYNINLIEIYGNF